MYNLYEDRPNLSPCRESIEKAIASMEETYLSGGKLLLCGNGGSCADCDHIVGELMKGFMRKRPLTAEEKNKISASFPEFDTESLQRAIPAISLSAHAAVMTAYINDVKPDMVYAQLMSGYGKPGDCAVGISTSGNSANVVNAMKVAKANGLKTIAMTGANDSKLSEFCDVTIKAPERETFKVQECHLPIYHFICAALEEEFFS